MTRGSHFLWILYSSFVKLTKLSVQFSLIQFISKSIQYMTVLGTTKTVRITRSICPYAVYDLVGNRNLISRIKPTRLEAEFSIE